MTESAPETVTDWPQALDWQIEKLGQICAVGASHHAWLITGAPGHGGERFVRAAAAARLCDAPTSAGAACGVCESCAWLRAGTHPDFREVVPDEAEEGEEKQKRREIKVDTIRELTEWAVNTSHRHRKVALIDPASAMNAQAANALLKFLEEPPPMVQFFMFTADKRRLPATIASRCASLSLPSASASQAQRWLAAQLPGMDATQLQTLLAQAGGAPLAAMDLAESEAQTARRAFLDALSQPATLSALVQGDTLDALPKLQKRDALAARLNWLARWLHDCASVQAGGTPRFNPDYHSALSQLAKTLPSVGMMRYYSNIIERLRLIQHPLNARLVLEDVLIQYKQLLTVRNE